MQKIRSIICMVSSKYRLIFSNFMHFGFNVGYAYECCVFCFRAKFQEVITRICLALPLLRWCGTEGLVGHLQPWNDLCVSRGLVQQQLPLPVAPPGARTALWVDACPSPSSGACKYFCCRWMWRGAGTWPHKESAKPRSLSAVKYSCLDHTFAPRATRSIKSAEIH